MKRMVSLLCVILAIMFPIVQFSPNNVALSQTSPPFESPSAPVKCEDALIYISDSLLRQMSLNDDRSYLIFILKPGKFEKQKNLSSARLDELKRYYLSEKRRPNAIFAEAERVEGSGVLEIYFTGNLLYRLPLFKNQKLDLITCGI